MLDAGILYLCQLNDVAEPGDMPREALQKIARHWYEDRVIGMNRQSICLSESNTRQRPG